MVEIVDTKDIKEYYTSDPLRMYIKEAKREAKKYSDLSALDQKELGRRYKENGDLEAQKILFYSNLMLVVSIAFKYQRRLRNLQVLDIIQEGNLGLIRAIEKYDPDRSEFVSCAGRYIRHFINRSLIDKNEEIRKPVYAVGLINKYLKLVENCEKNHQKLPDDEVICDILNTTKATLQSIRDDLKNDFVSMDAQVSSDDKRKLANFIPSDNYDADSVINAIANFELLVVLKSILSAQQYYVLYYRYISDERLTLDVIAKHFNVTKGRTCQIEEEALKKIRPYLQTDSILFEKTLRNIRGRYGKYFNMLKPVPLSPLNIIRYLYIRDDLTDKEAQLYEIIELGNCTVTRAYCLESLGIDNSELNALILSIKNKQDQRFADQKAFNKFKEQIIRKYGLKIFNINIHEKVELIDYAYLDQEYSGKTFAEILDMFTDIDYEINPNEYKLLARFFETPEHKLVSNEAIEREVNLVKFGFKQKSKGPAAKKLYSTFLQSKDFFSEEQQLYLKCFVFGKADKSTFREKYPNSTLYSDELVLINRLERLHYHIHDYFGRGFSKENWLKVKEKYIDRFDPKRVEIVDLYFGINGSGPYSRKELATMFNMSYDKIQDIILNTLELANRIYSGLGENINIDKDKYIPYLENYAYDIVPENREILRMFLVEGKSYEEISKIKNLSQKRISNIITGTVRKIDHYRFGVTPCFMITEEEFNDFLKFYEGKISEVEMQILRLRFLKYLENSDIALKLDMPTKKVNEVIARFNNMYYSWQIKDVEFNEKDLVIEVNRHPSESVLTDKEKLYASLRYGIKGKYNKTLEKLPKEEIMAMLGITNNAYNSMDYKIKETIKGRITGIKKPEFLYIARTELAELLDDVHLPISDKERQIICYLFELKGYPYLSFTEMANIFGEEERSLKVRYRRSIVTIYKYLNKEIDGQLDYEIDIAPILKYFGTWDRNIIVDYYQNGLTYEKLGEKYAINPSNVANLMNRLNLNICEILRNPEAKKFDFDYYQVAVNNPDLPFYGDKNTAIKLFDLVFGMNGNPRVTMAEAARILGLKCDDKTASNLLNNLMLSVCKLRDGITRQKSFTYDEVLNYYTKYKDTMPSYHKSFYERYLSQNGGNLNCSTIDLPYMIINDLIIASYPDAFVLRKTSKEEVKRDIKIYGKLLNNRVRLDLMHLFGIRGRECMSGKDLNHVFKILHNLDQRRKEREDTTLTLTKNS